MPGILTARNTTPLLLRALICCACFLVYWKGFAGEKEIIRPLNEALCNLSFPQAAVSDVNTIYIPFTLVGQLIMVQATVDTVTGYFMLDTGSERLVLNKEYFQAGPDGRAVVLTGSFNNWNEKKLQMTRSGDGWTATLPLFGGKHTYKFIIDGKWINDPANPVIEDDGKGNKNSVRFVY